MKTMVYITDARIETANGSSGTPNRKKYLKVLNNFCFLTVA